jgi:tRNA (cmo5U34)-methyltransferase
MNEFDAKAGNWDKNLIHLERSQAIARELLKMVPVKKEMKALEYGAGTGLLSFILKDRFKEIILMDSSQGMLKIANEKITTDKVQNIKTLLIDLEKEEFTAQFDIIYNQMVLHHVIDIEKLFKKFYLLLNSGGYLVIADLYIEDGSFHGEGFTGHKGFEVEKLSSMLQKNGYKNIKHKQCFVMKKLIETGGIKEYPVFILVASR